MHELPDLLEYETTALKHRGFCKPQRLKNGGNLTL